MITSTLLFTHRLNLAHVIYNPKKVEIYLFKKKDNKNNICIYLKNILIYIFI
jgi:hypothetical protein